MSLFQRSPKCESEEKGECVKDIVDAHVNIKKILEMTMKIIDKNIENASKKAVQDILLEKVDSKTISSLRKDFVKLEDRAEQLKMVENLDIAKILKDAGLI